MKRTSDLSASLPSPDAVFTNDAGKTQLDIDPPPVAAKSSDMCSGTIEDSVPLDTEITQLESLLGP